MKKIRGKCRYTIRCRNCGDITRKEKEIEVEQGKRTYTINQKCSHCRYINSIEVRIQVFYDDRTSLNPNPIVKSLWSMNQI